MGWDGVGWGGMDGVLHIVLQKILWTEVTFTII